jgi:hypothetical protein
VLGQRKDREADDETWGYHTFKWLALSLSFQYFTGQNIFRPFCFLLLFNWNFHISNFIKFRDFYMRMKRQTVRTKLWNV